jgi:histidinol-phosphate aminotransferase
MISVPLSNFRIDLNRMAEAVTPETKVVFICNPNNPTGSVLSMDEVRDFLDRIPEDIIVALDEAYIEFVSDEKAANGLDLLPDYPLLFVLRTFSKLYGLAGLRIGYGFASEKLINYINRVRQPFNAGTLAQAAATAALEDDEFVSRTLKLVGEGLRYLYHELDGMGLEYIPTQANFFLINVPEGGKKIFERLLKQGVIVRAMDAYGLPDYIRINVGLPEENERFIKTLKKVLP